MALHCSCGGSLIVADGRAISEGYWRRRRCVDCRKEYTTLEQFCETERGTRLKQPIVKIPTPPKVVVRKPKDRQAAPQPVPVVPAYQTRELSARERIERMQQQREIREAAARGWEDE